MTVMKYQRATHRANSGIEKLQTSDKDRNNINMTRDYYEDLEAV